MNDKIRIAKAVRRATLIARLIGAGLLTYGLFQSGLHINEVGRFVGLTAVEAMTLFLFIDILALFGKVLTSKHFVARTRRIGYKLMIGGGALSLGCNVMAGIIVGNYGRAGYGAFLVLMIVLIEYATANIKGKQVNTEHRPRAPKAPAEALTPRQIAARKGAETKRRRAAEPVSPATVSEIDAAMTI